MSNRPLKRLLNSFLVTSFALQSIAQGVDRPSALDSLWGGGKIPLYLTADYLPKSPGVLMNHFEALGIPVSDGLKMSARTFNAYVANQNLKFIQPNVPNFAQSAELSNLKASDVPRYLRHATAAKALAGAALDKIDSKPATQVINENVMRARNQILEEQGIKIYLIKQEEITNNKNLKEAIQRAEIRAVAQVLDVIKAQDPKFYDRAMALRNQAVGTLASPAMRAEYAIKLGEKGTVPTRINNPVLANKVKNGQVLVYRKVGNKNYPVLIPLNDVAPNERFSDRLIAMSKNGMSKAATFGISTASFLAASYAIGAVRFAVTAGANDPQAMEKTIQQNLSLMALGQYSAMFLSSELYEPRLAAVRKNLDNISRVIEESNGATLFSDKAARIAYLRQNLAMFSWGRAFFNSLVLTGATLWMNKISACNALIADKPMSAQVKESNRKTCDQAYSDYLSSGVAAQVITQTVSFMSIQRLFALVGHWSALATNNSTRYLSSRALAKLGTAAVSDAAIIEKESVQSLKALGLLPENTLAKLWRVGKTGLRASKGLVVVAGPQGLAAALIIELGSSLLNWTIETGTAAWKISKARNEFANYLAQEVKDDFKNVSDCISLSELGVVTQDNNTDVPKYLCSSEDLNQKFDNFTKENLTWRNVITAPIDARVGAWTDYFEKLTNTAKATRILYTDLVSQISAMRQRSSQYILKSSAQQNIISIDSIYDHAYEQLPMFRTSPLYGVGGEWELEPSVTKNSIGLVEVKDWSKSKDSSLEPYLNKRADDLALQVEKIRIKFQNRKSYPQVKSELDPVLAMLTAGKKPDMPGPRGLDGGIDHKVRILSQAKALQIIDQKLLDRGIYKTLACQTTRNQEIKECYFFELQREIGTNLQWAYEILKKTLDSNARPEDRVVLGSIVSGLGSNEATRQLAALRTLIRVGVFELRERNIIPCEIGKHSVDKFPECTFRYALTVISPQFARYDRTFAETQLDQIAISLYRFQPINYRVRSDISALQDLQDRNEQYGPVPLGPGSEYFTKYYQIFDQAKVESNLYPEANNSVTNYSMAEYLLVSTLCGERTWTNDEGSVLEKNFSTQTRFFKPPRLPLKNDQDACGALTSFRGKLLHRYIKMPSGKIYFGIAHLLLGELSANVLGDQFKNFWKVNVQEPLQSKMTSDLKLALNGKSLLGVTTAMSLSDLARNVAIGDVALSTKIKGVAYKPFGLEANLLTQSTNQIDFYFDKILKPIYNSYKSYWIDSTLKELEYKNGEATGKTLVDYVKEDPSFKENYLTQLQTKLKNQLRQLAQMSLSKNENTQVRKQLEETMMRLRQLFWSVNNCEQANINRVTKDVYESMNCGEYKPIRIFPGMGFEEKEFVDEKSGRSRMKGYPSFENGETGPHLVAGIAINRMIDIVGQIDGLSQLKENAEKTLNDLINLK